MFECLNHLCVFLTTCLLLSPGKKDEDAVTDVIDIPKRTTPAKGNHSTVIQHPGHQYRVHILTFLYYLFFVQVMSCCTSRRWCVSTPLC